MLCRVMKRLAKSLDDSSCAAALVGPKIFRPSARKASTTPAASGASGPTTVICMSSCFANSIRSGMAVMATFSTPSSKAVPALPGATKTFCTFVPCARRHASACSRPPEPITNNFIATSNPTRIYRFPCRPRPCLRSGLYRIRFGFAPCFAQALLLIQPVAVRFVGPAARIDEIAITIRELRRQQPVNSWGMRAIQPYQCVGAMIPKGGAAATARIWIGGGCLDETVPCLFHYKSNRSGSSGFINIQLHFAVLIVFAGRGGIVRTAATAEYALVKNPRLDADDIFRLGNAVDHHGNGNIGRIVAGR